MAGFNLKLKADVGEDVFFLHGGTAHSKPIVHIEAKREEDPKTPGSNKNRIRYFVEDPDQGDNLIEMRGKDFETSASDLSQAVLAIFVPPTPPA